MKKRTKIGNVLYDIDGILLDDLIIWAKKQKEFYPEYDSFKLETDKEYEYGQAEADTVLYLYGLKEETERDIAVREAKNKEKQNKMKENRKNNGKN